MDGLNIKVDQLCQLSSRLLEYHIRHQNSISNLPSVPPVVMNRVRIGNYFRLHRHRQRPHSRPIISSSTQSVSRQNSSDRNVTQPSSIATEQSRESLINLYGLFQDNLNSSKPDLV